MKITYCNSEDDLRFLENKKVILNSKRDSVEYAGVITEERRTVLKREEVYLVFLSNCPQNCEISEDSTFSYPNIESFKTSMYVGNSRKEFQFAIRHSECESFNDEWASILNKNISDYDKRVKARMRGNLNF